MARQARRRPAIQAIVTDIEGTTSSLSFVKDVLFPYSRRHIAFFVRTHAHEPAVARLLGEVHATAGADLTLEQTVSLLEQWIDEDRKLTPLKALQGMVWEEGYREGDFRGHVYEDAVRNLRRWKQAGIRLYVFSSGSVQAQKLLFGHTDYGDLTSLFSGYFDTTTGAKKEPVAYETIAAQIGVAAPAILFLSDIPEELDAAQTAGMHTCWLVRSGPSDTGGTASATRHPRAADFDHVMLP